MSNSRSAPIETATPPGRVFLVVDDDPMVRRIVTRGLSTLNPAEVIEREDGAEAQQVLLDRSVDVVITDVQMPNMDGLTLMKWAQDHCPGPLWIVLSGVETFDAAVEALQLGAFDYLAKPPEVPRVRVAVRNALDQLELVNERQRLYDTLEDRNALLAEKVTQLQTACGVLEEQASTIQADLDRAEVIQRALLPQQAPPMHGWCMETLYRPGSSVGGDFFDAITPDDDHLGVVIADAAGHGVAAAMLSVLFKLQFRQINRPGTVLEPAEVIRQLNAGLFDELSAPGAFITAAYVLLDLRTGDGRVASAGHPPCLISDGTVDGQSFTRTGPAIGLEAAAEYEEHRFQMRSGERLMLFTDGVIEGGPHGPDIPGLQRAMAEEEDRSAMLERLFGDAVRDLGGERDDMTILVIERGEGDSHFDEASAAALEPEQTNHSGTVETTTPESQIRQGVNDGRGFIAIIGSINWLCATAILNGAQTLLDTQETLTLDLSECTHMDSTCLGTLHEVITSAPERVELQGVSESVRGLFEELSMTAVLDAEVAEVRPLPDSLEVLESAALTPQQQGARILSAHESLVGLSDDNEEQFRGVVESLRADLQE